MIRTALSSLIVRTVYCSSELASLRIMRENSAACELYSGTPDWAPGFNSLYKITDKLLEIKPQLERFLCNRVDTLFNLQNRIILFDLTNFFFEGSKRNSTKAKFGRSKERRSDCTPVLRTTRLLGCQHDTLRTQAERHQLLLDRDSPPYVHAETRHHRRHQPPRQQSRVTAMQPPQEISR